MPQTINKINLANMLQNTMFSYCDKPLKALAPKIHKENMDSKLNSIAPIISSSTGLSKSITEIIVEYAYPAMLPMELTEVNIKERGDNKAGLNRT